MSLVCVPRLTDGLGNRLFQYAAAVGLSEKWKSKVIFLLSKCEKTGHGDFENIFKLFPQTLLETAAPSNGFQILHETPNAPFTFEEFPSRPSSQVAIITGCRQSEKYFINTPIIPDWSSVNQSLLGKYGPLETSWFLHVRLGDYRKLPHHFLDLRNYYTDAFSRIPRGSMIIWASDEPGIYKNYLETMAGLFNHTLVLIEEEDELETLFILSHCKAGGICSNSTFSWWAAYFSRGCRDEDTKAEKATKAAWYFPSVWGYNLPPATDIYSDWMVKLDLKK